MKLRCLSVLLLCTTTFACAPSEDDGSNGAANQDARPSDESRDSRVTHDDPFFVAKVGGRGLVFPLKPHDADASDHNRAVVLDFDEGALRYTTPVSSGEVRAAVLSADGSTLFYEGSEGSFVVDLESGDETPVEGVESEPGFPPSERAAPLAIAADGSRLVFECFTRPTGRYNGQLNNICVRENGMTRALLDPDGEPSNLLQALGRRPFASRDATVAYVHSQEVLYIVDLVGGSVREAGFMPEEYGGITSMSEDGSVLGFERQIPDTLPGEGKVFEFTAYHFDTGQGHVYRYDPHQNIVALAPSISPDGQRVATNNADIRVWFPSDDPQDVHQLGPVPDLGIGVVGPRMHWGPDNATVAFGYQVTDDPVVEFRYLVQELDAPEATPLMETSWIGDAAFSHFVWVAAE